MNEGPIISAVETVLDNGKFGQRTVKFETGLLARQAAGSVTAYLDDETMLLSATTAGKTPKDHFDFFPLTIDVEERMYAVGQIPGSFFRSEGRPGEDAILTCRLIDRPLRPTFKKGLRNEVQVVITVMALDPDMPYDVLAINAASLSTQLSGLPFSGPVGGVRVALIEGQWVAFPTHSQLEAAVFDMVVAGRVTDTGDVAIMMVEAEATEETIALVQGGAQAPTEEVVAGGLDAAKPFIKQLVEAQAELAREAAKPVQDFPVFLDYEDDVYDAVEAAAKDDTAAAMTIGDKQERELKVDEIKGALLEKLAGQFEGREKEIGAAFRSLNKSLVRERVLRDKVRIDGRGLADIRPLHAEVGVIPRVHGSALFERGETQILGVTTLNMLKLEQQLDTLSPGEAPPLHAQVRLPAVLHRRDRSRGLAQASRGRPRCARAPRPAAGAPEPRGVPLRHPSALRGHGLQRLHLDGLGLRLHAVAPPGRRAAEGVRRGHRDGPHLR